MPNLDVIFQEGFPAKSRKWLISEEELKELEDNEELDKNKEE